MLPTSPSPSSSATPFLSDQHGLIFLFIFYPIFAFFRTEACNHTIDGNTGNNGTGQAPFL